MSKKILYIWKSPYPWDVRVEKICKSLTENGYEVYILARWGGEISANEKISGLNIVRAGFEKTSLFSTPIPFNPVWKKSISNIISEIKPDLIIVREIMLAEDSAKEARKKNIPVIMDMAENYPACMRHWKKYNKSALSRFLIHSLQVPDKVEKRSVSLMDGIITVCSEQIERLYYQYNYKDERTTVVHNTPFLTGAQYNSEKIYKSLSTINFGHHGYHTGEKSISSFVNAFSSGFKNNEKFKLTIAGDGDEIPDLKEIAADSKNIIFLGKFLQDNLREIISKFDIGILPYQINDFNNYTIHNKIFDYFSMGIPVVVSEAKPLKRIVEETQAGIVINCESNEPIHNFLEKSLDFDWAYYSDNAKKVYLNKYNWSVDSKELIRFIDKFL